MSCPRCPHCIAAGAFGLVDEDDPALREAAEQKITLHKAVNSTFAFCGAYAFRYKDRRSGASVDDWKDVTCYNCLHGAENRLKTIAETCHRCRNGENVFRGDREWVHGAITRVRCEASALRDAHYGTAKRATRWR